MFTRLKFIDALGMATVISLFAGIFWPISPIVGLLAFFSCMLASFACGHKSPGIPGTNISAEVGNG